MQLDVASGPGVADVLIGAVSLGEATQLVGLDLPRVDGSGGRSFDDVAQRLYETLTGAGTPLLGVVANDFKSGRRGGYGYGYSYDYTAGGGKAAAAAGGPSAGGVSPNGAGAADAPVPTSRA